MAEINTGKVLAYRVRLCHFDTQGAAWFFIEYGYWDDQVPPTFIGLGHDEKDVPVEDVAAIMSAEPTPGVSRIEDMTRCWSAYFLSKGWIVGDLVNG